MKMCTVSVTENIIVILGDRDIEQEAGGQPRGEESADLEVLDDHRSDQLLTLANGFQLTTSKNCATNSWTTWIPLADEEKRLD